MKKSVHGGGRGRRVHDISLMREVAWNSAACSDAREVFGHRNVLRRLAMSMTTSTRQIGGVTVVDIKGPIVLGDESASVRDVVFELLSKGQKQILLNLGAVSYVDSMGLGSLVGALVTARKQGGELKLLNVSDKVTYVMQITKLYAVFDIVKDEETGVKSFGRSVVAAA